MPTTDQRTRARIDKYLEAMAATLRKAGFTVVQKGHHHEGPLHPELVHGDGAVHVVSVDGEHIAGPWPTAQ